MREETRSPNVDAAEIDKFARLAQNWWDTQGELKSLHDINPLRLDYIVRTAGVQGKTVLDVGCGGGILSESLARAGAARVVGIDMAEQSLAVARSHAAQQGVANAEYRCISVEDLAAAEPQQYDVVTCMEMLEHVPDPSSVIRACAKLAKPEGYVFFSTLNRNRKSYAYAIVAAEYVLNIVPKGTHDWQKFITPAELARMARGAGLSPESMCGLTYHPVFGRYALNDDVSVNYMAAYRA
ncbi:bifunctional 2-polyprenyl-6-hydroxyphenol methylase/3-demethylubiquinol 3-O-methyltransferase UbiG [Conchiformibius kuhniae]|uniref:Ubiquinone biosynthesis O-methyltransferase n=1 Tax=Conchiformibius kuhniae TaxID=211502 RepID=A0A8T9MSW2_9NEIS|nr:bifunctional 2-polyprenyl-6-hydroxyphenol methylase/3-demethylubiquinol 3-O-methyltransferase UbiG [Conchiformibius kuhniae]UOP04339.1 bifunctional 2-polyprenyl-6-hydroxyphenol methylase/3-demethylubiquinol 3-O-methyltransferase UbiG [Conchiformibius kuhniae]